MNRAEQVRALFENGATVECTGNSYWQQSGKDATGMQLRLQKVGKSVADAVIANGEMEGQPFGMSLPTRVKDVVSIGDREAVWVIAGLEPHTVGYRVVA